MCPSPTKYVPWQNAWCSWARRRRHLWRDADLRCTMPMRGRVCSLCVGGGGLRCARTRVIGVWLRRGSRAILGHNHSSPPHTPSCSLVIHGFPSPSRARTVQLPGAPPPPAPPPTDLSGLARFLRPLLPGLTPHQVGARSTGGGLQRLCAYHARFSYRVKPCAHVHICFCFPQDQSTRVHILFRRPDEPFPLCFFASLSMRQHTHTHTHAHTHTHTHTHKHKHTLPFPPPRPPAALPVCAVRPGRRRAGGAG